ncbi:sarcosine oxidase subunit gamma [Mycobacterium stomatepiae]|uniref:Sarcosine oxidase subunit gamma n=1 Tax=Mycobacterium stomatepiae TaxID=470076 RepID=A0A7I7Q7F3_9MYCO|nr:sarcosine oxidase subunit gamma family protein [Mycobacterium stomatepiae]MCV7163055.1 sarcosine oxidase subunit gamma [Mycobacterium stomatepiae]BBY22209.1 sarcosine oxidase subunit gamma [Mycobacterium stomatepiae]
MAETLTRRGPLHSWQPRLACLPETASVSEEPLIAMVDLWADPAGLCGTAAATVLGIDCLPTTPSTLLAGPSLDVIWAGPQEWLVMSTDRTGEQLETQLRAVITELGGAAVDVSAQRTAVRLRGEHARDVLAKGCSLDLHPRVLGPGAAAQTVLGLAAVVLIPLSDNGTDYRILVRSTFAGYLADWLIDAAAEYGAVQ